MIFDWVFTMIDQLLGVFAQFPTAPVGFAEGGYFAREFFSMLNWYAPFGPFLTAASALFAVWSVWIIIKFILYIYNLLPLIR